MVDVNSSVSVTGYLLFTFSGGQQYDCAALVEELEASNFLFVSSDLFLERPSTTKY